MLTEKKDKSAGCLGAFLSIPMLAFMVPVLYLLVFPIFMLMAWIRVYLWTWFAVPYLHLPPITFWLMLGFSLLISTFRVTQVRKKQDSPGWTEPFGVFVAELFGNLVLLLIGYIIHIHIH